MNRTIKLLMFSDIFILTGFGLIDPILAIFIKDNLVGGTIFAAGFASVLFLVTKSLVQLPFSKYIDQHDHRRNWLVLGTLLVSCVPVIYIFADKIYLIYIAQILYGLGSGIMFPTWLGLWSINLDRKQESFEWSLYSTVTGLGTAVTAGVGAAIAEFIGFVYTFILVGVMTLVGAGILMFLDNKIERPHKINGAVYNKKRKVWNKRQ